MPTYDDDDDLLETTTMTSGSGSGLRLLEQRTIARQIKKIEIVGTYTVHLEIRYPHENAPLKKDIYYALARK